MTSGNNYEANLSIEQTQIISTSDGQLNYLPIMWEMPEGVEYSDSSKYLATAIAGEGKFFAVI